MNGCWKGGCVGLRRWLYENVVAAPDVRAYYPLLKQAHAFQPGDDEQPLRELLSHAVRMVPHYRDLFAGTEAPGLAGFPVITRAVIRDNLERLKSDDHEGRGSFLYSTGGSTGSPLVLMLDLEHKAWVRAAEDYIVEEFFGLNALDCRKVIVWGSARDIQKGRGSRRKQLSMRLARVHMLNGFKMDPRQLDGYIDLINSVKPDMLKGYSGAVYRLARFARERNLKVHAPRAIYVTAETLTPPMREVIEEVFRCRASNVYGAREIGLAGVECARGKIHVFDFFHRLEVLDPQGNPAAPGTEGRIVITNLRNHAMPLIRYEIGDMAVAGTGCDCGSGLSVLDGIRGRFLDYFLTRDGQLVYGGYMTVPMFFRTWVEEFQILQRDVDDVVIYFVPRGEANAAEMEEISGKLRKILGETCRVAWEEVAEIPPTMHGKLLCVKSLVTGQK